MKRKILFILLMGASRIAKSQDFDEWFEQKKTQLTYLHQQIAAMEAYDQATEQGYEVDQEETDAISGIQQQDTDQHGVYFSSLKTVNPLIRGMPVVKETVWMAGQLLAMAEQVAAGTGVWAKWSVTISGYFNDILADCSTDLWWLNRLTTDGALQLTDEQRIVNINAVYREMHERYITAIKVRNEISSFLNN